MSAQRKTAWFGISLLLCVVGCSLALAQSTMPLKDVPLADSRLERGRKALSPTLVEIQHGHVNPSAKRTVFLIGENHAVSRAQEQVAAVLERLLDCGAVDAVLVEGSAGPLKRKDFADRIGPLQATLNPAGTSADYWREQLANGRIAGYEYVALARPEVDFYGVEDMVAKAKHDAQMFNLSAGGVDDEIAFWKRGVQKVETAIGTLGSKQVPAQEVAKCREEWRRLKDALETYGTLLHDLLRQSAPSLKVDREFRIAQARALLEYELLEEGYAWQAELERHEDGPQTPLAKARIAELKRKIGRFVREHERELLSLQEKATQLEHIDRQREQATKKLEPLVKKVTEAELALQDAYFIAANQVHTVTGAHGLSFPELATFFRDEAQRRQQEAQARAADAPELGERDAAMAKNTVKRMKVRGYTATALVVGKAHLKTIAVELAERGVSVIGGSVTASEDTLQSWEEVTWEARQAFVAPIFAREERRIPRTLLQNDVWKKDEAARLQLFSALPEPMVRNLANGGRIIEAVSRENTALWIGEVFDRNAKVGEHVLASGPIYGQGTFFQLYDREVARKLVSELSHNGSVFVYVFQTRAGARTETRVFAPQGEQSLADFLRRPPVDADGQPARRVIVCGEPDEVRDGALVDSRFWQRLRNEGGDSGRPPRGPWRLVGDEKNRPGGGQGIDIYATINMRRAAASLALLDRAESQHVGDIRFVEEHELRTLVPMFTPRRGDSGEMVFLLFDNTAELREILENNARWFVNKQVGLIACGDAFAEAAKLRETLLRVSALSVWIPDTQITPEAGRKLMKRLQRLPRKQGFLPARIDKTIEKWQREMPGDPDARSFSRSRHHVRSNGQYTKDARA